MRRNDGGGGEGPRLRPMGGARPATARSRRASCPGTSRGRGGLD
jgi:hypothetical protein